MKGKHEHSHDHDHDHGHEHGTPTNMATRNTIINTATSIGTPITTNMPTTRIILKIGHIATSTPRTIRKNMITSTRSMEKKNMTITIDR